jgi:calcium permeable stress-gated cation channel
VCGQLTLPAVLSQQIAAQVVSSTGRACLAPEPRDVVWSNMTHTRWNLRIRQVLVFTFLVLLFLFWLVPVSTLASLLSYEEIKKAAPWLGRFIDLSPRLRTLIQTSLPSFAVIALNGLLPFLLEGLSNRNFPRLCAIIGTEGILCQLYHTPKVSKPGAGWSIPY